MLKNESNSIFICNMHDCNNYWDLVTKNEELILKKGSFQRHSVSAWVILEVSSLYATKVQELAVFWGAENVELMSVNTG